MGKDRWPTAPEGADRCDDVDVQSATARTGSEPIGTALSVLASILGLMLIALGGALLARELINILDQDVRLTPLFQGVAATGAGLVLFVRASRAWNTGGGPAPTPSARVGRVVGAIFVVGVAIVAFAAVGLLIAGPVSDLQRFEDSCFEMDSILCGLQGMIGGAVAGLVFGIRAAKGALRGIWAPTLILLFSAAGVSALLAVRAG